MSSVGRVVRTTAPTAPSTAGGSHGSSTRTNSGSSAKTGTAVLVKAPTRPSATAAPTGLALGGAGSRSHTAPTPATAPFSTSMRAAAAVPSNKIDGNSSACTTSLNAVETQARLVDTTIAEPAVAASTELVYPTARLEASASRRPAPQAVSGWSAASNGISGGVGSIASAHGRPGTGEFGVGACTSCPRASVFCMSCHTTRTFAPRSRRFERLVHIRSIIVQFIVQLEVFLAWLLVRLYRACRAYRYPQM